MKKTVLSIVFTLLFYAAYAGTQNVATSVEQTIYETNKSVIDSLLNQRIPEGLVRISHSYKVPANAYKKLKHYVKQRELKLACQDFLLKDSLVRRVENKIKIEQCYTDSINTILIPVEGNHLSGENLSCALRCKDILGLDSLQYDYIMKTAVEMARRIKEDYRTEVRNDEMAILKTTLNKQQLLSFFQWKNAEKVTVEFDEIMEKLKNAGLTEQLDSAKDVPDAVKYLFNRQMIKELYRNQGVSQKRYLSELDKSKPVIIRMLDGLNRKDKNRKEEQEKTMDKDYTW